MHAEPSLNEINRGADIFSNNCKGPCRLYDLLQGGFSLIPGRITNAPSAAAVSGTNRSWRAGVELRGMLGVSKIGLIVLFSFCSCLILFMLRQIWMYNIAVNN